MAPSCAFPWPCVGRCSFDFITSLFTAHARPLLAPSAAQESLAGAPSGTRPHTRVDGFKTIAVTMVEGAAQRSDAA
eukprot:1968193-Prymnesium_polylepis.1